MNFEEELNMLNDMTTTTSMEPQTAPQPVAQTGAPTQAVGGFADTFTQTQPIPQPIPVPQPMSQPMNQPAMVSPTQSQAAVDTFNFASMDVDINKTTSQQNPLSRLVGQQGDSFRLHLLPNANPKEVWVHWDQEQGHNFGCLAQAYNTPGGFDECCKTHGKPRQRYVVPVILVPSNRGQVVQDQPLRGELKCLVVSGKTLDEIKDQAAMSGTAIDKADIIASTKDVRFKTFNYAINPVSTLNQVTNLEELKREWDVKATSENVIGLCGRLISRAEYQNGGYAEYDYKKYKQSYGSNNNSYQQPQQPQQGYQNSGYQQGYQQNYQPTEQPYGTNPYGY